MIRFEYQGQSAVPIRAVPFHGPGLFNPATVLDMLVDVEKYGEAPALAPFAIDASGAIREIHPLELIYVKAEVMRITADNASIDDAISAMPGDVMLWGKEIKARYDFLDEQLFHAETKFWFRQTLRGWFESPHVTSAQSALICANVSRFVQQIDMRATSTTAESWPRKRDAKGGDASVQEHAVKLADMHRAKHGKLPSKKQLLPALMQHFGNHKKATTIEREFSATWKRH